MQILVLVSIVFADSSSKPNAGKIVGIIVGISGILLVGAVLLYLWRRRHRGYRREVFVDVAGLCYF